MFTFQATERTLYNVRLRIARNLLETRVNHQNFDPSVLPYIFGLIFMGMKEKFKEKSKKSKIKKADSKKTELFNSPNSQYFFTKISGIGTL